MRELLELAERVEKSAHIRGEPGEVMDEALFVALEQGFRVVVQLRDETLMKKLSVMSREHPHLKLRQAAISALK